MSLGSGFAVFLNHCKFRHESAGPANPHLGALQTAQYDSRIREQRSPSRDVDQLCDAGDDSPPKPPIRPAAAGDQIPPGPAHPTPQSSDYALNYGDEPVRRKFLGASSSQVLVQWLDLSFSRRGPWPNISHFFRYGISTAEEFSPTLWISPKPLPHHSECAKYLSVYKLRIHPLFPVLDLSDFASTFTKLSGKDARSVSASDLPSLACCHAVTSIGMDAISGKPSETATEYLSGAYSMYAHIVAMPYQRSIQALLLLALALRTRHKEGVAWHVIGHAIRMAQSLGLHRHQGSQEDTIPDMELDRNIWWSLFCLEKMMALQTGRPSAIHDEDCDQTTPPTAATCSFLHHLVGLAQVQSAIARSMTTQSGRRRGMHEFLHDTLQLDHQLVEWEQKLPNNLRPGSALYCTPEDQPFASFFSVSYHEALITLHRTALILDTHVFREQIKRHVPEIQASYRLSRAEDICVASARTIVQMLNELKGSCGDFVHPITASSPLLATFVLTISILKHPGRWNVRSDLALLLNIASLTEGIFQSIGQDPAFNKMFALMRDAASKHTEHANPHPEASHIGGQSQANRTDGSDSARRVDLSELPTNNEISYSLQPSDAFDLSSEEPWARLLSGNLDFEGGPWDFNLESFLGLPNFEEGALWL
ncbi:hypothetical protein SLS58_008732 [Diplodia intermedia]|uniref:Xylanolytic transcriptional activator regulatory domain-containing protein n=1 Tax=Diplodia intermedia TaxID=856260 RepID=A0ABR3TGF3_9PEZI